MLSQFAFVMQVSECSVTGLGETGFGTWQKYQQDQEFSLIFLVAFVYLGFIYLKFCFLKFFLLLKKNFLTMYLDYSPLRQGLYKALALPELTL